MKRLTPNEIQFVKDTGVTPTVYQCDEWYRTIFTDEKVEYDNNKDHKDYLIRKEAYANKYFKIASDYAAEKYGVDLDAFMDKNLNIHNGDSDGISLEYVAVYLLYSFFTKEELENLTSEKAIEWLQNYRYFGGFRKWYGDCGIYIGDAIKAHEGLIEFYEEPDGNVWYREIYE